MAKQDWHVVTTKDGTRVIEGMTPIHLPKPPKRDSTTTCFTSPHSPLPVMSNTLRLMSDWQRFQNRQYNCW